MKCADLYEFGSAASGTDIFQQSEAPKITNRWGRRALTATVLVLAASIGLGTYGPLFSASPSVKYRLAAIDLGPIVSAVSAVGTVRPLAAILVGSQASGQIKELLANFNSPVQQGDVIARLNDDAVEARLTQALVDVEVASRAADVQRAQLERARTDADGAKAAIAVAQADAERAEAMLKEATRELERKRDLLSRGVGAVAERERAEVAHDSARTQLASAKARILTATSAWAGSEAAIRTAAAQLENALAQIKHRQAIVQQVRIDLAHTVIRAPIDGIVIDRNVEIGQTVAASLQAPTLFTIAPDLRAMEVHANVDEADIGRLTAGQAVSFTVDSFPSRPFRGRVVDIRKMPQTTQNVVSYTVVISADNEDLLLLPGMTANARILVRKRDNVLRMPVAALRFRPAGDSAPPAAVVGPGLSPERLLRTAVDRLDLALERRREVERVIDEAGCAQAGRSDAGAASAAQTDAVNPCRDAVQRVLATLSAEERARYDAARSQLARDDGIASGDVWIVGAGGTPERRRLKLGVSDGLLVEVIDGDLHKGDQVILGAESAPARPQALLGF